MGISRGKRSTGSTAGRTGSTGIQIAQILPNGDICFAGRKLAFRAPSNTESLRDGLNTFIMMMAHRRGKQSGYFQPL